MDGRAFERLHVDARARRENRAHRETERDGDGRRDAVVDECQEADLARALRLAERSRAANQREQDERHDDHLDELHEEVAERREHVRRLAHDEADDSAEHRRNDDPEAEPIQAHAVRLCLSHKNPFPFPMPLLRQDKPKAAHHKTRLL